MALYSGSWQTLPADQLWLLAASGIIGILIGDTALFASMNRLGPRRAGVLFADTCVIFCRSGLSVSLGETLWGWTLIGSGLLVSGVMCAILFGKRASEQHHWETANHQLGIGIGLGLLSALCQAVSTLMLKPLMETDIDAHCSLGGADDNGTDLSFGVVVARF